PPPRPHSSSPFSRTPACGRIYPLSLHDALPISLLLSKGVRIHFAHRTFQWNNEARGQAAVHCVIVGFGLMPAARKLIFEYESPRDRKSTRLNSSHVKISYAVLCLYKKRSLNSR